MDPTMESSLTYENCSIFKTNNLINFPYNIFGQQYSDNDILIAAIKSKIWFTYRSGFEPLIDPIIKKQIETANLQPHTPHNLTATSKKHDDTSRSDELLLIDDNNDHSTYDNDCNHIDHDDSNLQTNKVQNQKSSQNDSNTNNTSNLTLMETSNLSNSSEKILNSPDLKNNNGKLESEVNEASHDHPSKVTAPTTYLTNLQGETSNYLTSYMNSYTSDSGWGCAVRVGQMLLAETYLRLLNSNSNLNNKTHLNLLNKFNDNLSSNFSFLNLVLQFKASDKNYKIGTWLGPNNVCHSLKKLVMAQNERKNEEDLDFPKLNCFVCMDSTVVVPELPKFSSKSSATVSLSKSSSRAREPRPLLLLVPLRLGLESIYADTYRESILKVLSFPQSVGIIGGRPRSAYYFFGYSQSNKELLCLDPHTVQNYHNKIDESNAEEFVCDNPLIVGGVENLDPSMALGFLCKNQIELDQLLDELEKLNLVAVMRSLPDFGFPDEDERDEGAFNDDGTINNEATTTPASSMSTAKSLPKKSKKTKNDDDFDMPDTDDEFEILVCESKKAVDNVGKDGQDIDHDEEILKGVE